MGYSLNSLKKELSEKGYADDGLVGWGQNNGFGGALLAAGTNMHVVSKMGDKIVIFPFTNKAILYDKGVAFDKQNVVSAKVGGFWIFSKLVVKTVDGNKHSFAIAQGKNAVKEIVKLLGF